MPISRDDRGSTVLSARGISKSFNDVPVLFGVDFDVRAGEIHALMGENGAGKSTLVKILSGFEAPTSGDLILDGQPITLPPDGKAEHVGIVLIHQEMNLADHLTVTESLFLGREMLRFGLLNRKEMRAQTRAVLRDLGADVHEDALISDLTIAQKQMVEIAKAISRRARVIFMDEPTAVLSQDEVAKLFAQVRKLRDQAPASSLSRISSMRSWPSLTASRCCATGNGSRPRPPATSTVRRSHSSWSGENFLAFIPPKPNPMLMRPSRSRCATSPPDL